MAIIVERGKPQGSHGGTKYPFRDMKPGDSFLIGPHDRAAVYGSATYQLGGKGKITVRAEGDKFRVRLK